MPIIHEVKKPCNHRQAPVVKAYWFGTIWQCDDFKAVTGGLA